MVLPDFFLYFIISKPATAKIPITRTPITTACTLLSTKFSGGVVSNVTNINVKSPHGHPLSCEFVWAVIRGKDRDNRHNERTIIISCVLINNPCLMKSLITEVDL